MSYVRTEEHKRKMSEATRGKTKKGHIPWNKGKIIGPNPRKSMSHNQNPNWSGGCDDYWHIEANRLFGKPNCENCGMSLERHVVEIGKRFHMHCISRDYKIMQQWNWRCLCISCHVKSHRGKHD